ncbi:RNA polymerase sigma factor [candidate division KSB1 bacterium]
MVINRRINKIHMESTLIDRCRLNEQTAYKELYELFKDRIYSTAIRILGDKLDAEDAVHDIFIKVFRNIHSFRKGSSIMTWIYRIAVNTCLDKLKSKKAGVKSEDLFIYEEDIPDKITKSPDFSVNQIFENAIKRLPEGYRTVFILYAIEGFRHKEIAEILNISSGTSKSQYFAARSHLRKYLIPYKEALL